MNYTLIVLLAYTVVMFGATVLMTKEDFLKMMVKPDQGFSKAEFITKI